ncbi:response regulator transcription factor [uncultured Cohaesibacter sp.]|uniref:response regulator transcription factor n=1 Tax=uncultured Cohaesibacter sp. TaxID=1002546 RepID=UPI0029C8A24E|nr:response regulator transcription factor [uncultured Cohaesibacter sp.]
MQRIHIIEDDQEISSLLSSYLEARNFQCVVSPSAEAAYRRGNVLFDLMIVDLMLPGESGLDFCRKVRTTSRIPIIILSAVKGDTERIIGLELGADDYMEKPFNPRELLARINALLRRTGPVERKSSAGKITFDGWVLDLTNEQLHAPKNLLVPLSTREYSVLSILTKASPNPVSRDELAQLLIGHDIEPGDRRIDILVSRLRKKLMDVDGKAQFIKTVRNQGYKFCSKIETINGDQDSLAPNR